MNRRPWLPHIKLAAGLAALALLLTACSGEPPVSSSISQPVDSAIAESTTPPLPESSPTASSPSATLPLKTTAATTTAKITTITQRPAKSTMQPTSGTTTTQADSNKLAISVYDAAQVQGKLAVWFFSMPSESKHTGDCSLIRTPDGKTMPVSYTHLDVYKRQGQRPPAGSESAATRFLQRRFRSVSSGAFAGGRRDAHFFEHHTYAPLGV